MRLFSYLSEDGVEKYGNVEFADDKDKKYPIDTEEHIRAAWNYINMPKNAAVLDNPEAVKRKIIAAWKEKIDKDGPPSAIKEEKERTVYSMYGKEIRDAEKVIEYIWSKLEQLDENDIDKFFNRIEREFGEDYVEIVDHRYSADKLHYYQNGRNKPDTYDFIKGSAKIKKWVDSNLK